MIKGKYKMEVKGERKKYNAIDLTKFIMAIFVIAVHTYPLEGINNITVLDVYKSIVYVVSVVSVGNEKVIKFYENNGFKMTG